MTQDLNIAESISHLAELLPIKCRNDLNKPGCAYNSCKKWLMKLNLHISRDQCIYELKEFGTWDEEELNDESDTELNIKYLWCAAGYEL